MQEERQMILKMIEDGKISAEEGMRLLNALKDEESGGKASEEKSGKEEEDRRSEETKRSSTSRKQRGPWDYQQAEEKFNSFASKFSEFVDDAVHRVKDMDLDFNFGSSEGMDHVFEQKNVFLKEADIHVENGSIDLRPSESGDVHIKCDVQVYRVRDKEEARREFLRDVEFSVSNGKLKLESRKKSMKVNAIVYMPVENLDKLKLYTFNGKMKGEHIPVHELNAKAVNGKISFERIDAKECHLETMNGSISVKQLYTVEAELKTMNGSVDIEAARGNIHIESVNGTVHFRLAEASQAKTYIKTTTGSIFVAVPENAKTEGEVKTSVGGIHCQLSDMSIIEEKKEFASKKMTFIANKQGEGHFYIEAEAVTGSVHVK
ncbi:MAG: DUF4097 domain-containing protein [Alkalicoccus sp.]|nr:MAG: DUF4097 domain-containing protein [Alkalicoccus sp.]